MEDVEQRRERLAAMRQEAISQPSSDAALTATINSPHLADPFDTPADTKSAAVEMKASVFDFYTDPLAGFASSKRRRPGSGILPKPSTIPQSGNTVPLRCPAISPPPPSHLQPPPSYPPGVPVWQPTPYRPPFLSNPQHPLEVCYPPAPPHLMSKFPTQSYGYGRGAGFDGRSGSSSSSAERVYSSVRTGGTGYHPSNAGGGRGYGPNRRGTSWSGRTSTENLWGDGNKSPGRGQTAPRDASAKEQPHLFFKRSMLEDPWQHLEARW